MILIVKSKLSLINLQNLVIKSFLQLENNHKLITLPPSSPGIQPFIDSLPPLLLSIIKYYIYIEMVQIQQTCHHHHHHHYY